MISWACTSTINLLKPTACPLPQRTMATMMYHHGPNSMSRLESYVASKSLRELQAGKGTDPVERLRLLCLSRGPTGILALGRLFRRMDEDGEQQLTEEVFLAGLRKTGMDITEEEAVAMFNKFNTNNHGRLNMEEFLIAICPPMSYSRIKIMEEAFNKIDKTGDGVVTLDDLKNVYSVKGHPLYVAGEESEETIRQRFLANFELGATIDGHVTHEEFFNFYSGVSASIDKDVYFELMMRQCYKL